VRERTARQRDPLGQAHQSQAGPGQFGRGLAGEHTTDRQLIADLHPGLVYLLAQRRDQPATGADIHPERDHGDVCLAFAIAQAGLAVALADGRHAAVGWSWPELAGFAAFVVLTTAIGSAIGSALHNTAAAIVTYFALAAVTSLLLIPAVDQAGSWVNTGGTFGWMLAGQWSGHGAQIASSASSGSQSRC
jgi:hypothetical protein